MSVVAGIDLGTTNSCIAVYEEGKVNLIQDKNGKNVVPSVVYYDQNGEIIIGEEAVRKSRYLPERGIYDAKRFMGRKCTDVNVHLQHWPFKVVEQESGTFEIDLSQDNQHFLIRPEEVSAEVLKQLKENAEKQLKVSVSKVVIAVPAYFTNSQRQATIDAARIAGLKVLKLIQEPTAAALAFAHEAVVPEERLILVYDLGGGTFDVSLIQTLAENKSKVLAMEGDNFLGGRDFDKKLLIHILDQIDTNYDISLTQPRNKRYLRRIEKECETVKQQLSATEYVEFEINGVQGQDITIPVSREKFEDLNIKLFESTLDILDKMLKDANVSKSKIDEVLLVGGSTRIPKIQKMVQDYFNGKIPNKTINPDEAVAVGAAIQAALLSDQFPRRSYTVEDVTPRSLGVEVIAKETMNIIIKKNTPIPVKERKTYYTFYDQQTEAVIRIFEGENTNVENNNNLGELKIEGITPMPKGKVQFVVIFEVNSDGILKITAKETSKSISRDLSITLNDGRLTKNQIETARERMWMSNRSKDEPPKSDIQHEGHGTKLETTNKLGTLSEGNNALFNCQERLNKNEIQTAHERLWISNKDKEDPSNKAVTGSNNSQANGASLFGFTGAQEAETPSYKFKK